MNITLTELEIEMSGMVGLKRNLLAVMRGYKGKHGVDESKNWDLNIEGACAEFAVAKAINRYWEPTNGTFKSGADIGKNIQVRRRSKAGHDLIIRRDDNPEHIFFLITGSVPNFTVQGWIKGQNGMKEEYLQGYGGRELAFFVPQNALSMAGLE
jgi:hypothetical protein